LAGNIYYNYLAGTILHYMRSEREKSEKLDAATLLKETSWLGSWRSYLGSYAHNHLNAVLGEEYEDFVKFILSGKNENFTLINKKGNPYAYLQNPKNNKVFTHPLSYSFREGEEMVQKDDIGIEVPYMASKIVLLENTNPDSMVLVNYKRKHSLSDDHLVYHVSYDFQKEEMAFVDISDSLEFNFLLEARRSPLIKLPHPVSHFFPVHSAKDQKGQCALGSFRRWDKLGKGKGLDGTGRIASQCE